MSSKGRAHLGRKRVLRGGSWINNGRNLRSANRNGNQPDDRNHNIGLRLAGALWAGGSVNQRPVLFQPSLVVVGQSSGPQRVSKHPIRVLVAESLPAGRPIHGIPA